MALRVQSSFSTGELDPALHERTTLEKYNSGLHTGRNIIIGKTGRLLSRPGRRHLFEAKYEDKNVRIHVIDANNFIEMGVGYIRLYVDFEGDGVNFSAFEEVSHDYTAEQIAKIQFLNYSSAWSDNVDYPVVFLFCEGRETQLYFLYAFANPYVPFGNTAPPTFVSNTVGGTGYDVSYAITIVKDGLESFEVTTDTGKLPIAAGTDNTIKVSIPTAQADGKVREIRVYRRPRAGGAFGFVGSSTTKTVVGADDVYTFVDTGVGADYTHQPPSYNPTIVNNNFTGPEDFVSTTGSIYQQRLIMSSKKGIEASRTGYPYTFTRDYPYSSDSSLSFSGTRGARVLWIIENEGLVVFQTDGIYLSTGTLTPTNLALDKKGNWIIDPRVPPIAIPGGVLFVDRATNTVRLLSYSLENGSYTCEELSIFSNHLFERNRITSWAFQEGSFPLLWVTFNDGTFATFTYEREHQMRAWTRHDSGSDILYVAALPGGTNGLLGEDEVITDGRILFLTKNGTKRNIEVSLPRYVTPEELENNPEADKWWAMPAMDAVVSWKNLLNDVDNLGSEVDVDASHTFTVAPVNPGEWTGLLNVSVTDSFLVDPGRGSVGRQWRLEHPTTGEYIYLTVVTWTDANNIVCQPDSEYPSTEAVTSVLFSVWDRQFVLDPVTPGVWDGNLNLSCGEAAIFTDPGPGEVGKKFKHFHPVDRTEIILEVISRTDDNNVVVTPSEEFPSEYATDPRLYEMKATFDGLDHMEGEEVAIISDGYVLASPNNNIDSYPVVTVSGGAITLPDSQLGAIVHVGRPYTMDIETLEIDSVEQRPVLMESKTVNKVYVKTHESRGLFIGNRLPAEDGPLGDDSTGTNMVKLNGADSYDVNYEEESPIVGNRYDQPKSRRLEISLPGDWKGNGKTCIRQVDPLHFEILSIIPDIDDQRR